jgi:hypothetical protein
LGLDSIPLSLTHKLLLLLLLLLLMLWQFALIVELHFDYQDFKPKLIDFPLVSKGIMGERSAQKKYIRCVDPYFNLQGTSLLKC